MISTGDRARGETCGVTSSHYRILVFNSWKPSNVLGSPQKTCMCLPISPVGKWDEAISNHIYPCYLANPETIAACLLVVGKVCSVLDAVQQIYFQGSVLGGKSKQKRVIVTLEGGALHTRA